MHRDCCEGVIEMFHIKFRLVHSLTTFFAEFVIHFVHGIFCKL